MGNTFVHHCVFHSVILNLFINFITPEDIHYIYYMFSLIKGVWNTLFQKANYKILLIGLDQTGKTALLNSLKKSLHQKYTALDKITPTIGLNIATIEMGQY